MLIVTAFFQPFASSQSGVSGFGRISPPRFQPYQSTTTMQMTLHYERVIRSLDAFKLYVPLQLGFTRRAIIL